MKQDVPDTSVPVGHGTAPHRPSLVRPPRFLSSHLMCEPPNPASGDIRMAGASLQISRSMQPGHQSLVPTPSRTMKGTENPDPSVPTVAPTKGKSDATKPLPCPDYVLTLP